MEIQLDQNTFLCTNVQMGDMLMVHSDNFNVECWGYARSLHETGITCRLELEDSHSAIQDTVADGWDPADTDNIEIEDTIPFDRIEYVRYLTRDDAKVRVWKRSITPAERAKRARTRGFERLSLPDLDAGLRR